MSNSLRLNAFFSKYDVKCAKMRYYAQKKTFFAHYRFYRNESTGKRENALNYADIGELALKQAFSFLQMLFSAKTTLNALKRVISR